MARLQGPVDDLQRDPPLGRGRLIQPARPPRLRPALALAPVAVPAVGTAYFAFQSGGFFPQQPAVVAIALLLGLVLWLTLRSDPLAHVGLPLALAIAALAAFAVWTLVSGSWSGAPGRALPEYGRALTYLVGLVATGLVGRSAGRLRAATYGVLAAIVVASGAGVVSRLLPSVLHVRPAMALDRLSYPLTYWNGMGIFAAVDLLLAAGVTCSRRGPRAARLLAAASTPVLATALLLTFSRGAIAAAAVGLVVLLVAGRPAGWIGGLGAVAAGCAAPVAAVLSSDALVTDRYLSAAGRAEGRHTAVLLLLGVLLAAVVRALLEPVDRRVPARIGRDWRALPRLVRIGLPAGVVVAALAAAIGAGAPGYAHRQFDRFKQADEGRTFADQRRRLLITDNNGRLDEWRVALRMFRAAPLHGAGAGTYQTAWARERRSDRDVVDGHSLYLEVAGELGIVGLLLILAVVLLLLWGLARLARGPDRVLPATLLAAGTAWALHAGIDWDWELPATGFWLLSLGGLALSSPAGVRVRRGLPQLARVVAALGCLVLVLTPLALVRYQPAADAAARALVADDCGTAVERALTASSAVGSRSEPYEVLGFCDVRLGYSQLALRNLRLAVQRDRDWWETWYGLALVQGATGQDPRAAARHALALNPREPLAQAAVRAFERTPRRRWRTVAGRLTLPVR